MTLDYSIVLNSAAAPAFLIGLLSNRKISYLLIAPLVSCLIILLPPWIDMHHSKGGDGAELFFLVLILTPGYCLLYIAASLSGYFLKRATIQYSRRIVHSSAPGTGLVPLHATLERPEGTRWYLVAAPPAATPGGRGLVVVLHGAGASAEQVMGLAFPPSPLSLWLEIAAREQLVVMAPDAGNGGWSDCYASAARVARKNDVGFIAALIDHAIAHHDVDPSRVYLIGVSRGGWMAYAAATGIPHKLAAFSVVLAGMPLPGRSKMPTTPLPALIFGCTNDPLIYYHGGKPWYALGFAEPVRGIEKSVHAWRELAGLSDPPEVSHLPASDAKTSVTRYLWGRADGMQVGLYRIEGAGHAEPSRRKRYPRFINWLTGRQNADLETAEAAWEFFRGKRLRQP